MLEDPYQNKVFEWIFEDFTHSIRSGMIFRHFVLIAILEMFRLVSKRDLLPTWWLVDYLPS